MSVVDPSDDHVGAVDVLAPGETEADVAERLHLHLENDVGLLHAPQQPKVVVEVGAVVPSDLARGALRNQQRQQQRGEHLSFHFVGLNFLRRESEI